MSEITERKKKLRSRFRQKNPEYTNIVSTKTTKAKLKAIATAHGLSITGLLEWWVEEVKLPMVPPAGLAKKYPSSSTAYKKTWQILVDYVLELVQNKPGLPLEYYTSHRRNYTAKQIEAGLEWLCREGAVTRTIAGFFPVLEETPG